jgi:hypothetical protein
VCKKNVDFSHNKIEIQSAKARFPPEVQRNYKKVYKFELFLEKNEKL